MSGSLVPSSGLANFAQQGSVDWVSLSNSTLSFSVEVLSRFSKAGVEMVTVAVGQAIFSAYNIPPEGQKRLSDAVSKLQAFSSYGKVLWFGFGIKHVVRSLCETEQGAACAAMCACLSVSYDTFYASKVLKELADACLTPTTLTPALSQWAALINVCAGAVTDSKFPVLVEGFSSLVGFPSNDRKIRPFQEPTTAKALAGALLELSKVSNGTTRSVTFEGGADCGWLAAVAQWLLGLSVEIFDASGGRLYSDPSSRIGAEAQVIIIRDNSGGGASTAVSRRSFSVPPGALSFVLLDNTSFEESPRHFFLRGRSEWTTILQDTFGTSMQDLLTKEVAPVFAQYLCMAFLAPYPFTEGRTDSMLLPWDHLRGIESDRMVDEITLFAAQRLPELESLQHAVEENPEISENIKRFSSPVDVYFLGQFCHCGRCGSFTVWDREKHCLEKVALTIVKFLWILSWVDLHDSIRPSSTGLLRLYFTDSYKDPRSCMIGAKEDFFEGGIDTRLFSLFTGITANQTYPKTGSAAFESGICIHQYTLTSMNISPLQNLRLRVLPGQIYLNERVYTRVSDYGLDDVGISETPFWSLIQSVGTQPTLELVVEETISSGHLTAKSLVQGLKLPANYFEYLRSVTQVRDILLKVPLFRDLNSIGPRSVWRKIGLRMNVTSCSHTRVEVKIIQPTSSQPARVWTGDCSLAGRFST